MINLTEETKASRLTLFLIIMGDLGSAIGRVYVFNFLTGTLHLVSLWVDYLGFATMHYCHVLSISFLGGIEALMLFMHS